MPLIDGDVIMYSLTRYRKILIKGKQGDYKTALAFYLAYLLMINKNNMLRYIISNVDSVWNQSLYDIEWRDGTFLDAVIIYDEGGKYVQDRYTADNLGGFMRKSNSIIITPSEDVPNFLMFDLAIWKSFDFYSWGIPIVRFKWESYETSPGGGRRRVKDHGVFHWIFPKEIFGIYDSAQQNISDRGIGSFLREHTRSVIKEDIYVTSQRVEPVSGVESEVSSTEGFSPAQVEYIRAVLAEGSQEES